METSNYSGSGQSLLTIERDQISQPRAMMLERKGWGHPDTLADHLSEHLSRIFSRHTLKVCGAILHHNFDKLAILGGLSEVRYGGGQMRQPVRVLVNGRAARMFGGEDLGVDELIVNGVEGFFSTRLPLLGRENLQVELNVTTNSSPGAVHTDTKGESARQLWFAPRSRDDLRERKSLLANDTSLGTGYAPAHPIEDLVRALVDECSAPDALPAQHPWWGSDVKVMAYYDESEVDIVTCIPQISAHVGSRREYIENKERAAAKVNQRVRAAFPDHDVRVRVNLRDLPERDELYLTLTGSSIESGDEGLVGRGNRANGLITPMRPMNVEGVNGKNPVYHVGKLYNVLAGRLASSLADFSGGHVEVHMVSGTGQPLDRPWRILVRLMGSDLSDDDVRREVAAQLTSFESLTDEIVHSTLAFS